MIRRATPADAEGIFRVHRSAILDVASTRYTSEQIEAWAGKLSPASYSEPIENKIVFVADDAGQICGFGQLERKNSIVEAVYVLPGHLRRGLGGRLLSSARASGLTQLTLDASLNSLPIYAHAGYRLTPVAAARWREMSAAALTDGVVIQIASAFRSIDRQAEIIRAKLAEGLSLDAVLCVSAPPGYSEHHSGRAVDVTTNEGAAALEREFENTLAFRWLSRNAGRCGVVLSYPAGNPHGDDYEPWHRCLSPPALGL